MRPFILGIGGTHSGSGKTTVASLLLRHLKGWGAIKYTKTSLYSSIIDDVTILSKEGKDTRRLLDAGAEKVLWVQSPYAELKELLAMAIEMLSHLKGIIIEGNTAVGVVKPDLVIFLSGSEDKFKKNAQRILDTADIVIFDTLLPPKMQKKSKKFSKDDSKGYIDFVQRFIRSYGKKKTRQ